MIIHTIFDVAAWIAAWAMSVVVARRHYLDAGRGGSTNGSNSCRACCALAAALALSIVSSARRPADRPRQRDVSCLSRGRRLRAYDAAPT
jgi:hypothetical protein